MGSPEPKTQSQGQPQAAHQVIKPQVVVGVQGFQVVLRQAVYQIERPQGQFNFLVGIPTHLPLHRRRGFEPFRQDTVPRLEHLQTRDQTHTNQKKYPQEGEHDGLFHGKSNAAGRGQIGGIVSGSYRSANQPTRK